MNFLLQNILFVLLVTQFAYPQWTNQNLVPDRNDLWSTFFINDSTGWMVGSSGFIKKTTTAGNEWFQQNSGTNLILKAIQFVNQNTGWICGEFGLILKSTDGGTTWDSLQSGTTQHLSDIYFYDTDTGYVVGFNGTILKTTNGGSVWTNLNSETSNDLLSLDFVDAFIGYAAGEVNDTSSVIKTTDGGSSWIDKSSGFPRTNGNCITLDFINANVGFIGGGGGSTFFYKTTNGGDTWAMSGSLFQTRQTKMDSTEQLSIYPYGGITSVYFKDSSNGWFVDWSSGVDNIIRTTTDGGITWNTEYIAWGIYANALLSIFLTQHGNGLAVGVYGIICLKKESTSDWSQILSGMMDDIHSIYFIDENIGWAVGSRYGNPDKAIILKTTNSGKIWKTQMETSAYGMNYVHFINELFGWAVDSDFGEVYLTTDGGDNWNRNSGLSCCATSVFFVNQNTGWLTAKGSSYEGIYKSIDGGVTWTQKSSINSSSIYFSDINNGWAVGVGGSILKSTDSGESWVSKTSGTTNNLNCVNFYNSNVGMCVGNAGTVLLSSDGGESWVSQNVNTTEKLASVQFTNSSTIWIAGDNGTILNTTDLGNNWTSFTGVTGKDLTSLSFVNEYTGWFAGMDGTMFKYSVEPPPPPTPPVWTNQITTKDASGTELNQVLTFGQHIDATDSIDASLGEYELPPAPPPSIFDTRFNLPTNPQVSSLIDYRDSAETNITWNLTFQPSSAGYPMTFSWDSTAFPEGTFYLKDRINGSFVNVNMKNQSSYTLTNQAINSLSISYRGLCSIMSVNDEWNIISVPLLADDMTLSNLFPSATSPAYSYNAGYISHDTLETGKGYWLKFGASQQLQICGLTQGDTVSVHEGWNLFGIYEKDIPLSQITTTPPGVVATYFFEYNDGYYIADTLLSGKGFWVRVTDDGVINLNGGLLKNEEEEKLLLADINPNWGKIIITDNEGKSTILYATDKETDFSLYELPPPPPAGVFDVRYSSGKLAENISSEKIIQITSENYPITIRAEGINIIIRDRIKGELLNEELTSGEEIMLTNYKISSIEVSGKLTRELPISYELYQNFPNPFNSNTVIKFSIPEEAYVTLNVYNVLGEKVIQLVDDKLDAGKYSYNWDANDAASGIYICELRADKFVTFKKMVLLR